MREMQEENENNEVMEVKGKGITSQIKGERIGLWWTWKIEELSSYNIKKLEAPYRTKIEKGKEKTKEKMLRMF